MSRKCKKPRDAGDPAGAVPPSPHGLLELKKRPSGRWAVFSDGEFVATTGTSDARLAAIRLRMYQRTIH